MADAILLALLIGSICFFGIKMENDRQSRESHAWWLSDVRSCIVSIEAEFRRKCKKIAEEEFSKQSFNESRYRSRIRDLENSYRYDLTDRVIALKSVRVTTIPDHLEQEYIRNISDISDIFLYFGDLHHQ